MYQLEISELERRCLERALRLTRREDAKSDGKEAKNAVTLESNLITKLEELKKTKSLYFLRELRFSLFIFAWEEQNG